jgi:murein DD-endopeptidase MepM/ murein hydrolase activator NlpD
MANVPIFDTTPHFDALKKVAATNDKVRLSKELFFLLLLFFCGCVCGFAQGVKFVMPLKGVEGRDYFTIEYVDHDPTSGFHDPFCGSQTYDGHTGTDFCLRSFKTMDSGIYVYAAADGVVSRIIDGKYDRSKRWNGGGLGNHIVIAHKNDIASAYGHLMAHSMLVHPGDSVKAGQPIAKVGSSGKSACPHLHFEVMAGYMENRREVIDPFTGSCQTETPSMWLTQPAPDTAVYAIDAGFVPYTPNSDTLQERYLVSDTFHVGKDPEVCMWVLMHGLQKGDIVTVRWYTPKGRLWREHNFKWKWEGWYKYSWSYMPMPDQKGKWLAKYYVNDRQIVSRNFYVLQ